MKNRSSGGCSSFLFMLFIIFVILKVTGAVTWSWWWITAPLWMPAALLLGGVILAAVMGVSIYRVASTVLGRQRFGQAGDHGTGRPGSHGAQDQVVEAEGTEVTSTPTGTDKRALPQTSSTDSEDSPV